MGLKKIEFIMGLKKIVPFCTFCSGFHKILYGRQPQNIRSYCDSGRSGSFFLFRGVRAFLSLSSTFVLLFR